MPAENRTPARDGASAPVDVRALVGSAFLWSWVGALYMSAFFVPFGRQGAMAEAATWGVSLLGVPVCLVLLWQRARMRRLLVRRGTLWASGAVGVAGSLLLIGAASTGNPVLLGFGALLGALFMTTAIAAWGAVYCGGGMRSVAAYVAGGFACTLVPNVLFTLLVPPASAYAFAVLPFLSMGLLAGIEPGARAYAEPPAGAGAMSRPRGSHHAARRLLGVSPATVCGLVLIMLGVGYMEHRVSFSPSPSLSAVGDGVAVQLVHGVVAALLFAVMCFWPRCTALAYRVGLLVIVAGFSSMPFLYGSELFWLSGATIIAGYVVFDVLIWVIVAQSSLGGSADPFVGVCVMRLVVNGTFCSLGGLAGMLASRLGEPAAFACADAVLVGYLVTIAVMLVLGGRDVWGLFEKPDAPAVLSVSEQLRHLADDWGLTERERDVFELLAVGRTQPWVAARLGISENTVDSHVRRIYAKSGVNSRQELLDLVFPAQSRDAREGCP